jgi:hypothetical protein
MEACIPRMFLGEASRIDAPVATVGLVRELEWREGAVSPHRRPVIELPVAVNNDCRPVVAHPDRLAPVVNIRLESRPELRTGKKIGVAVMLGAVGCLIVADIARQIQTHQRADAFRLSRSYLQINPGDDYDSIVHKLGPPASDRQFAPPGQRVFRELSYPRRQFAVVLMGSDKSDARYIGTLDPRGRILDAPALPDGTNAAPLLRSVP